MKNVVDITGREINVGDILAVGQRSGNSGDLHLRVVSGFKVEPPHYSWETNDIISVKTTVGGYLYNMSKVLIVPQSIFVNTELEETINKELEKVKNA